jgi:aminoglycoside phosphotransferase (APT) family kinase protein
MADTLPQITTGLVDVREAHRFDVDALDRYLQKHLDGYRGKPEIKQFEGGQSNPTFLMTSASTASIARSRTPTCRCRART